MLVILPEARYVPILLDERPVRRIGFQHGTRALVSCRPLRLTVIYLSLERTSETAFVLLRKY